jgi:diguanylate cyclase (GGDEF)-like protein
MLLLTGVASYLLAEQRKQIWRGAQRDALNIALGLETAAASLLQSPRFSLLRIRTDLSDDVAAPPGKTILVLVQAMRSDPVSQYLGITRGHGGGMTVVGRDGNSVSLQIDTDRRAAISHTHGSDVVLGQLVRLPGQQTWYLPLTLGLRGGDPDRDVAFALVPARRLVAGTESLRLVPESWVSFVTADGTRLMSYSVDPGVLNVNGGQPVPPELLSVKDSGITNRSELITGRSSIVAYVRTETLPLFVGTIVPISSLYRMWIKEAIAPLGILVTALIAITLFALQRRASLLKQRRHLADQEFLATHDTLTGLLNRDAFMRLLGRLVKPGVQESFAVVLMDLNRFKDINDTLGHAAGDRVLEESGKRLNALLHTQDACVARLGGDELVIVVSNTNLPETIGTFCEQVQACLGETILLNGVELNVTASMGVALFPADAKTPAELLRCADIAMYAAKNELRSYSRYSRDADKFTPEMLALKSEFARALREGGLAILYQPQVRLSNGEFVGLEALSRWVHPRLGVTLPAAYVKLVEATEFIHPFTIFMVERAARQVAHWRAAGHSVPISVNISANNLLDHHFVQNLSSVLESAAIPGSLLELEITESAVMRYPGVMLKRLHAVRDLGVRLSIDDFGTGYATLSYLKRLPVQTLKIDKSFVVHLADDQADQRIVRSSIQLAHGFGMTVVAEGVESEAIVERLREYQCDYAQGFYFAAPTTPAEIEAHWLKPSSTSTRQRGTDRIQRPAQAEGGETTPLPQPPQPSAS